jgi:hypothetical protein
MQDREKQHRLSGGNRCLEGQTQYRRARQEVIYIWVVVVGERDRGVKIHKMDQVFSNKAKKTTGKLRGL